jgi:hypothetical protein
MSFLNWFSGKSGTGKNAAGKAPLDDDSAGQPGDDSTRPVVAREQALSPMRPKGVAHAASAAERSGGHKAHRHAKRELLYIAVREAMIRSGVLSADYKFKVLSLGARGDQFMVMMDLAQDLGGQTERLAEMEGMIAQSAKSRYDLRVTAVYWRINEQGAIGRSRPSAHGSSAPPSEGGVQAALAAVLPESAITALNPSASHHEPIQADEVAAFRKALATASGEGAAVASEKSLPLRSSPHSYALLTGFEDTAMPEPPDALPALSASQYGDLI